MHEPLQLRPFTAADYPVYNAWFEDPDLQAALGGVDAEWLAYVLGDTTGRELAVCAGTELVGVIGVTFPADGQEFAAITNLATKPSRRSEGIGSKALHLLVNTIHLPDRAYWACYVARRNLAAQRFFAANHWTRVKTTDMVRYEYRVGIPGKASPQE